MTLRDALKKALADALCIFIEYSHSAALFVAGMAFGIAVAGVDSWLVGLLFLLVYFGICVWLAARKNGAII